MIPGELILDDGEHLLNTGRRTVTVVVQNQSDRPIQVGSHYHFAETNGALGFDRAVAQGNIAAATAGGIGNALSQGVGAYGDYVAAQPYQNYLRSITPQGFY